MEQKMFVPNKARLARSSIQVEDDVHFVLDKNNCFLATAPPLERPPENPQKTKKIPVTYQPVAQDIFGTITVHNSLIKDKILPVILKGPSVPSGSKVVPRKRKTDFELLIDSKSSAPKKLQKQSSQKLRGTPQTCADKPPPKALRSTNHVPLKVKNEPSSDDDIEIVHVKLSKSSIMNDRKPLNHNSKKVPNAQPVLSSSFRKRNYFGPQPISKELLVNEADTAPPMPANPNTFPGVENRVNSMQWLSAKGTISVPGSNAQALAGGKEPKPCKSETISIPEIKTDVTTKRIKRELKELYENLNEISWTKEQSFKKLLRNPDYIRHSERAAVKVIKQENTKRANKVVLSKKPANRLKKTSAVSALAQKKSRIARLNPKLRVKIVPKQKSIPKIKDKTSKQNKVPPKKSTVKAKLSSDEDEDVKYQLAPVLLKQNLKLSKNKILPNKGKSVAIKKLEEVKMNGATKLKPDAPQGKANLLQTKGDQQKMESSIIQFNPDVQKLKSSLLKLQPNGPKTKFDHPKLMPSTITIDDSPPSTSGTQSPVLNSKTSKGGKSSEMKGFLNKIDSYGIDQEMKLMHAIGGNGDLYSAVQKASKLRVRLEPLEHTNLWSPEFYEEFRRHMLDQALRKAFETHDHDSVSEMYQELLDSFSGAPGSSSSSKVLKKKKHDEEALRISVRQSEGAFRYKEIVVKKHPNYMQVVLVPNMMKNNSLTVEALKELKDAFLLAKKDPSCKAVLLNSSGSYFCSGLDLSPLVGSNKKQAAEELSNSVKELVITLGLFTKPVVAAVNGACVGFGVALLTYCDIVLASDKATFCLPAAKIGYLPEGGVTLTLPQVVGSVVASEMLIQGRRLTAEQAQRCGLVSEVLWPTRLMNEVIPRLKNVISQPLTAMEATKTMVRCHLWDKLRCHVERERRLLCEHWQSATCQANIKAMMQAGWMLE